MLEALSYGGTPVFRQSCDAQRQYKWDVKPNIVSVPDAGRVALGRLHGIEEATVAYTALTIGIGVYNFPFNVMCLDNRQSAHETRNGSGGLADDAGNYLYTLREIASGLHNVNVRKGIIATLRRINPTVKSIELDSLQNPQRAIVAHSFGEKHLALDLSSESDGFRRFYAHLLALYQSPPKQTLVFEEPENGIYPGALSMLADEFKSASECDRGQVIITTHSPRLLDYFAADQIRVVELENLETKIGALADDQREALNEDLLRPGELLTVDLARRKVEAGPE